MELTEQSRDYREMNKAPETLLPALEASETHFRLIGVVVDWILIGLDVGGISSKYWGDVVRSGGTHMMGG